MWAVSIKSAQPGFNIINLKKFVFPYAPLSTQKKIVKKLDRIITQIENRKKLVLEL